MDKKDKQEDDRPFAYPKPTENDQQLKNQPEYMDQEPNAYEKPISDVPAHPDSEAPQTKDR